MALRDCLPPAVLFDRVIEPCLLVFILFPPQSFSFIIFALSHSLIYIFDQHLVRGYGYDDTITVLLNHSRIHFLVSMNPDGFEKSVEGTCGHDKGRQVPHTYNTLNHPVGVSF